MYTLSYSDDAPSTPNASWKARLASDNVTTTTPLGPPPGGSHHHSTTPTSLPPASSLFAAPPQPKDSNQLIPSSPPQLSRKSLHRLRNEYSFEDSLAGSPAGTRNSRGHSRPQQPQGFADDGGCAQVGAIARSLSQSLPTDLWEDDAFILKTERIVDNLTASIRRDTLRLTSPDVALGVAVHELVQHWQEAVGRVKQSGRIGPEGDAPLEKATFIASLLLQLRHPNIQSMRPGVYDPDPVSKILLDWLRKYHWPFRKEVEEVMTFKPNPTASVRFWDVLFSLTLHGELEGTIQLLDTADFSHAATALDEGAEAPGYHGIQLGNTHKVIKRCIQVLESSPGIQRDDWDIRNSDWMIFRKRVSQAIVDLEEFAEGENADRFAGDESGMSGSRLALSLSQRSRRAESKVPWSIYQNLNYLYGQLLGTRSEVVAASADWLEAVLGTVIWWDGDDGDAAGQSHRNRRLPTDRLVDTHTHEAYMQKLCMSVQTYLTEPEAEEESDLQVSPVDHVEVGLACVLSGHVEGLINILRGWSTVISTAIVEIADVGGWLYPLQTDAAANNGFNESDLLVLSYGGRRLQGTKHDEILVLYAELLAKRARLEGETPSGGFEGWQLALEVLRRVKDEPLAYELTSKLLDRLDLADSTQVKFTASLCEKLELHEQSQQLSLRYADHLMATTDCYGEAVTHYVHAGQGQKIIEVFQLLTSLSVVHSMAYPSTPHLDSDMLKLCTSPNQTIAGYHRLDSEAGEALRTVLSGYATVREFYWLRDYDIAASTVNLGKEPSSKPKSTTVVQALRPLARKRRAAAALVALIQSASDGVHGGLYDVNVRSAIPVECLLPLLGEALAFVKQTQGHLTAPQTFALLKAVEDISTAPSSVQSQSEACLSATLAACRDPSSASSPSAAMAALKKSTSGLSASSSAFSLLGSEDLGSMQGSKGTKDTTSTEGSGVLVNGHSKGEVGKTKRGWDWRAGFGQDQQVRGETVLGILRLQLSNEVARTWTTQR